MPEKLWYQPGFIWDWHIWGGEILINDPWICFVPAEFQLGTVQRRYGWWGLQKLSFWVREAGRRIPEEIQFPCLSKWAVWYNQTRKNSSDLIRKGSLREFDPSGALFEDFHRPGRGPLAAGPRDWPAPALPDNPKFQAVAPSKLGYFHHKV